MDPETEKAFIERLEAIVDELSKLNKNIEQLIKIIGVNVEGY